MRKTTIEAIIRNNQIFSFVKSWVLWFFVMLTNISIQAQFTCDPAFYQIIDNDLLILNTVTGNYDTVGTAGNAPEPINAAGYNRLDDHIYGLGVTTGGGGGSGQLFRIEDDGSFTQLTSAPFNESSVSGDVDDNNHLWIRSSGNQGRNMKRISLDGTGATPYAVTDEDFPNGANVLPGQVGGIADIVYIAGTELGTGAADYIFAVSEDAILIIWEISTQTVFTKAINGFAYGAGSAATGNLTPGSSGLFGAGWTDRNGNLFFSNNGTAPGMGGAQAAVWQITDFLPANSGTATATWITDSAVVTANDGAGCPLADTPIPSILDCTQPTAIIGLSDVVINAGDNTSFMITDGSPGTLSWQISPATGVSQAAGTGASTGVITFANSGSYILTYTLSNNTSPAGCNSTETSEATATITVNSTGPVSTLPPFSCDNILYQIIAGQLRTYNPVIGEYSDPIAVTERYNATGYNRLDNYVYAIGKGGGSSPINNHLIRVGANGVFEDLGAITGFTAGGISGDVDDSDNLWINIGEEYHRIENISALTVGGTPALVPVTFTGPAGGTIPVTTVNDVVFINGSLYGVNNNQEVVIWNLGTLEKSTVPGLTTPTATNFGAAFTDAEDRLYVSYNNGGLYLINDYTTGTPSESLLNNTVTTTSNDGFACPLAPSAIDDDDDITLDPLDLDVDGDGIPNIDESPTDPYADADADGVFAYLDDDDLLGALGNVNGNVEPAFDTDSDGIPDFFDLDSDNDGIYDAVEAGHGLPHTNGVITGQETGSGANGLFDALEDADTTTPILQYTITNTSGGGAFDFQTTDADGDGCSDTNENVNNKMADGNDGRQFGDNDPQTLINGEVDVNGLVIAATYNNAPVAAVTDSTIFTTCEDGDGVDASVEDAGPNGGDGNNDGIPDSQQPHVASILDAVGDKYITLEVIVTGDCAQITNMSSLLETDLPEVDQVFDYPRGLVNFTLQCGAAGQSADVSIYWHNISEIRNFRKYGSSAPGAGDASYDNFIANTTSEFIDGRIVPVTSYTLTDGLAGDESATPALIVDPVGPGLIPSCRTIVIGSQAGGSFYNIDGGAATAAVDKLTNPANFGAGGAICCYSFTTVTVPDPITEAAINAANIDIWWSGFEADANYSAAEIVEIQNWIANGGFVIAGCDSPSNDPMCALLGITLTGVNVASGTSSVVANLGTCFPDVTGPIANGGGAVTTFSGTAGLEIITTQDQLSGPSVVYGNGIVALTDINMITQDGSCCMSLGSGLANTNDFFLADIVCELASLADVGTNCFDPLDSDGDTIADIDDLDDDNDGVLDAVEECQSVSFTGTWSTVSASSVSASLGTNTVTISQAVSSGANTSWTFTPNNTFNVIDLWSSDVVQGAAALDFVFFWDNTPEVESPASNDSGARTVTLTFTTPVDNPVIHIDRLGGSAEFISLGGDFISNSSEWTLTTSGVTMNKLTGNAQFRVVGNRFFRIPNINLGQPNPGGEPTLGISGTAAGSIQFIGTNISTLSFEVLGIGPDGLPSGDGIRFIVEDCIEIDTDNDGISNHLDLDSDGDGCPDAIEGGLNFMQADLTDATNTLLNVPNNNNNDGSVTGYLGITTDAVLSNLGIVSDTDPVSPTFGVPLSMPSNTPNTQSEGGSTNAGDRSACCTTTPPAMIPN